MWGFFCILSHLMQQELPLFEEKNLLLLDSLILLRNLVEGKKKNGIVPRDKKSGINHLDVPWGYLNNVQ